MANIHGSGDVTEREQMARMTADVIGYMHDAKNEASKLQGMKWSVALERTWRGA